MKKKKQKAVIKEAKQLIKKELAIQVVAALKPIAANYAGNKNAEKLINKSAKQLAKKLSGALPSKVAPVETSTGVVEKQQAGKKQ